MNPPDDFTDFELLRQMADSDAGIAREAWATFYVQHQLFLHRTCLCDHAWSLGVETVKEIVQDTFVKAFKSAPSFDTSETCEPEVQQRKVRAWLSQIAENLIRDRFRGQPEIDLVDEGEIDALSDNEPRHNDLPESEKLRLLRLGFESLSDVEQTVLRATMFWWRAGERYQRMPNSAVQQLSEQTGKTPENIRQIRIRAMNKLEDFVRSRTSQ